MMLGIHSSVWTWPIYIHLFPKAANDFLETLFGGSCLIRTHRHDLLTLRACIAYPMVYPMGDASPDFPIWVIMGGTPQQPPVQFHDAGPLPGTLFCQECGAGVDFIICLLKGNYCRLFIVGVVEIIYKPVADR